jgi:carboxyl-terminal processing protease
MLADDVVVEVDGEDVTGQDINLIVSKLRGPKGTSVNVGVRREGEDDLIRFDITRDEIESKSVDYKMLDGDIGYIDISEFADPTADQFNEAYDDLESQGMKALIIDLRSNGGGYVDISVEIADRLVKDGVIVSVKDKHGLSYKYEDAGDDNYLKIPCVLLVDGNTASASEILTGALKDYGLATVIGTTTFGKGITQIITPLDDGSGVKITNSKYYTPNGENIHEVGIEPDIEVEWDYDKYKEEGIDNQLEAAKEYLEEQLK